MANDVRGRNDLTIYDTAAGAWWNESIPWVRLLRDMVPGRLRHFDRIVGSWTNLNVLDLGCAGGFMAETLAERGALVTGIDPASLAIEAARGHAATQNLSIRFDVGAGEKLPYQSDAFDIVVCVDVLEHVEDLSKVFSEVRRVLRPDGLFLFDTINRNWLAVFALVTVAENILGLVPKGTHDPAKFIRPSELRAALTVAGFVPGTFVGFGPRWLSRRHLIFGWLPTTAVIYIGHASARPEESLHPISAIKEP